MRSFRHNLLFAITGWIAGVVVTLGFGLLWPRIFLDVGPPTRFSTSYDYVILATVLLIASPAALVGGLVGGRLPREGGRREQLIAAVIFGIVLALPFGCLGFWYSGW